MLLKPWLHGDRVEARAWAERDFNAEAVGIISGDLMQLESVREFGKNVQAWTMLHSKGN